jgi:hypothetical protein
MDLDSDIRDSAKDMYNEEQDKNNYYKAKSHNSFPLNMGKDEAWKIIKMKFPNPPHVYLNNEIESQINDLLKTNQDVKAVSLIRNATQFDIPASKGLAVFKKLEMYAGNEGNSFSDFEVS